MNSEFDREIDGLLRGHLQAARGGVSSAGRGGNGHDSPDESDAHLDADELNAYAERALPDATRTRYTSHLADCDRCRKIASSLALSSGIAAALERREVLPPVEKEKTPSATWGARLAALFSPRVVRFAAPALAICLVGVVAYVALRSPSGGLDLAKLEKTQQQPSAPASEPSGEKAAEQNTEANQAGNYNAAANANTNSSPGLVANTNSPAELRRAEELKSAAATDTAPQTPPRLASAPAGPPATLTTGTTTDSIAASKAADEPPPASERPSARKDAPAEDASRNSPVQDKKEAAEDEETARVYAGAANTTNISRDSRARKGSGGGGEQNQAPYTYNQQQQPRGNDEGRAESQRGGKRESERAPSRESDDAAPARRKQPEAARAQTAAPAPKPEPETRTVGGRRFRKQDGAWVDTAYRPSQAVTNVSRNSENYRGLVADEPGLHSIARQFDGEVVVVWKGRAYRIR